MSKLLTFPTPKAWQRLVNFGVGLIIFGFGVAFLVASVMSAVGVLGSGGDTPMMSGVILFSLLMGLFFMGAIWMMRLHILPFQFVADAVRRECVFRCWAWTTARVHIPETSTFVGQLTRHHARLHHNRVEARWKWSIMIVDAGTGKTRKLYTLPGYLFTEESASADCQKYLDDLADSFSLPAKFDPNFISASLT